MRSGAMSRVELSLSTLYACMHTSDVLNSNLNGREILTKESMCSHSSQSSLNYGWYHMAWVPAIHLDLAVILSPHKPPMSVCDGEAQKAWYFLAGNWTCGLGTVFLCSEAVTPRSLSACLSLRWTWRVSRAGTPPPGGNMPQLQAQVLRRIKTP
jgi:hypothetical protein